MLKYGNKDFLNLEEQVAKNQKDIERLETGVKIEKWLLDSQLASYITEANVGKYYLVYRDSKDYLYIITHRDNGGLIAENLGEYPKAEQGPQGIQGPKGDKGDTGAKGDRGYKGEDGPMGRTGAGWDTLSEIDTTNYTPTTSTADGYVQIATSADLTTNKGTADEETKVIDVKFEVPVVTKADVGLGNIENYGRDTTVTKNSTNYITSGGVFKAIDDLPIKTIYTAAYENDFNNIGTTTALPTGEYFVYFIEGTTQNKPPISTSGIVSDHVWLEVEKQYYSNDHYLVHQFVSLGESFYHRYADVDNGTTTWTSWEVSKINPNIVTDTVNTTQSFTAANNTEYYFGTLTSLTVTFPTGNTGDIVQINFTGTASMTVALGSNVTSLDTTFEANKRYSITAQKDNDLWWLLCVERAVS